ncbi:MAG: S-layer homology domain-containing protein [Actinomycetota bacterium]
MNRSCTTPARRLPSALLCIAVTAATLAFAPPAGGHDESQFAEIDAPFACGTEWAGGTRSGHGENNWNLDFNRTSLVWPDRQHDLGQPLYAQADGVATYLAVQSSAGTYLDIDYGDYGVRYIHLVDDSVPFGIGTEVKAGDFIGLLGDTGNATHAHLHLEYWDSRGFDDARIWTLRQAGQPQTEITFAGNVVDPGEVIVSTNCVGDALAGGIAPTEDDPLLEEARRLLDHDNATTHLTDRLAEIGATSLLDTTDAADFIHPSGVVAKIAGTETPDEVVAIVAERRSFGVCAAVGEQPCAHATNNAAPVAALLAVIERLVSTTTGRTILLVLVDDTDAGATALADLIDDSDPDPALDALLASTVAAIHVGALGENATARVRNDSLLAGSAAWADWAAVAPADGHPIEPRWHTFAHDPLSRPAWDALAALGVPVVGITDLPGPCSAIDADTPDVIDADKLRHQIDAIEALVRRLGDADDPPTGIVADPTDTAVADVTTMIALLRETEFDFDVSLDELQALVDDAADPLTDDDVAAFEAAIEATLSVFNDGTCEGHRVPAPFTDVPSTSYAEGDVALLYDLRITTGTSPTEYSPLDDVTREQMAAFLGRIWRVFHPEAEPTIDMPFEDVAETSFAWDDVRLLFELGITTGTSPTSYSPLDAVTREQMAAFLARTWRLLHPDDTEPIEPHPFLDVAETSFAWDDISLIYDYGITTGTSPTTYSPTDAVTREQMAAFLGRLLRTAATVAADTEDEA